MVSRSPLIGLTIFSLASCSLLGPLARGQELRVETDVFVGSSKEPLVENLTLFSGNYVYDFLLVSPAEITVFDIARERFVLLDVEREVKTELRTKEIQDFLAEIKVRAQRGEDDVFFNPRFEQTFEEESGWLTLRSDELTYRVRGVQPKSAELVHRYRQFADWYARLNGIKPGNLPPFARLEVNRALAAKGLIPAEVERTRVHSGGLRTQKRVARSRHLHNWLLSSKDRDRIHQAGQFMARFTPVSVQEYFRVVADDEDSRK